MRRTTLGPINGGEMLDRSLDESSMSFGGHGKSRKSFGAAMTSSKSLLNAPSTTKKAPTQSRMSLAPGGPDPRRSSLFGRGAGGALGSALVDPRPFTTKAWMNNSIDSLAKFLVDRDYAARITPKLLASPTGKDFLGIMSFLFRLLDPQFVLSPVAGKMEDDVQLVFKTLKYPFQISKTSLTAVGSQQSWPALLGSIMWLIELLEYDRLVRETEAPQESSPRAGEPSFFFAFLKSSYEAFLSEEDDRVDQLKQSVADAFGVQHNAIEQEVAAKRSERDRLAAQLAELKSSASKLPSLRARKSELGAGIAAQRERLAEAEGYCGDMAVKMGERKRELEAREQELAFHRDHLARVQAQVDSQELHPVDVEVIAKKKGLLKDQAAKLSAEARAAAETTFKLERELKEAVNNLKARMATFASECTRLQVLPMGAKFSGGVDFSLCLDEGFVGSIGPEGAVVPDATLALLLNGGSGDDTMNRSTTGAGMAAMTASSATSSALLGTDVKGTVKAGLREIRAKVVRMSGEAARALQEAEERCAAAIENRRDGLKRLAASQRRLADKEAAVEAQRSELDAGLTGLQRRMDELEAAVSGLRAELAAAQAAALELSPHALQALAIQVKAHIATLEGKRRATLAVLTRLLTIVHEHKFAVAEKLSNLVSKADTRLERVGATAGPARPQVPSATSSAAAAVSTAATPSLPAVAAGNRGAGAASAASAALPAPPRTSLRSDTAGGSGVGALATGASGALPAPPTAEGSAARGGVAIPVPLMPMSMRSATTATPLGTLRNGNAGAAATTATGKLAGAPIPVARTLQML